MSRRARRPGPAPTAAGAGLPAPAPRTPPGMQLLRAGAQLAGLGAVVSLALVVVSAAFSAGGHGGRVAAGVEVAARGATGPSASASYLHDLDRVATRRTGLAVRSLGPEWHKLFAEESAQLRAATERVQAKLARLPTTRSALLDAFAPTQDAAAASADTATVMASALAELEAYTARLDRQREAEAEATMPSLSDPEGPEDQEDEASVTAGAAIFYGPAALAREPKATTEDGVRDGEAEEVPRTAFRARHEAMLRRFAEERSEVRDDGGKKLSAREAEAKARGDRRAPHPHSASSKSSSDNDFEVETEWTFPLRDGERRRQSRGEPSPDGEFTSEFHGKRSAPDGGADAEDHRLVPDVVGDEDQAGAEGDWDTLPDWDADLDYGGDGDDRVGADRDGGDAEGGGADGPEPSRLWTETEVDFRGATDRAFPKTRLAGRDAFGAVAKRTAPLRGERPVRLDSRELGGVGARH